MPASPQVEALAEALLDDVVSDALDPTAREGLAARLRGRADVRVCAGCGDVVLARYGAPRCRMCGARAEGEAAPRVDLGDGEEARAPLVLDDLLGGAGGPAPAAFALAPGRAPRKPVALWDDNEDWETRGERLRQEAAEAARKAKEEAERKAREAAEKKAREAAEKKAREEAEKKAREEAEKKAREEAEQKAREAAEKKAREAAEKKAREEAEKKAREEAEKRAREAAEQKARLEAEAAEKRAREEAEAAAKFAAAEAERARAEAEKHRPSLGVVLGAGAGEVSRIDDGPAEGAERADAASVWLRADGTPVLVVPSGVTELRNGRAAPSGVTALELGDLVTLGDAVYVLDKRSELTGLSAPAIHFARKDDKPGGPWPYWNEPVRLGAASHCELNLVDDGVALEHARVVTRFGRVVIEDTSKAEGLIVGGQKVKWAVLEPGRVVKVGAEGPELVVQDGQAELKPKLEKAARMKPSRHVRTKLDVLAPSGEVVRRVFVFSRREVRFGNRGRGVDGKLLNELIIAPGPGESADIGEKQGGLALTRDGLDLRRDGGAEMFLEGDPLTLGKAVPLPRQFHLQVGDGLDLEGRVFRSPAAVERTGIPQLGMKGGHPLECVRIDRVAVPYSYIFLVRMIRFGSETSAPLRLALPGVKEGHGQFIFTDGKFQIVATRTNAPIEVVGVGELEPGVPTNLAIDTEIKIGQATVRFTVAEDGDFDVGALGG